MAKKTYVLDTSVYLTDSNCINCFGNNDIVIPLKVLEEKVLESVQSNTEKKKTLSALEKFMNLKK